VENICFSPASLALLGTIGGVLQVVIVTLFYGWIRSLERRVIDAQLDRDHAVEDARGERDRAADNLERALNIGETTAGLRAPRRR
jgi:hypothetical protein